ncbi:MAG TPA: universal stress protein [Gammaproteobacteria bacterium]|nr:universal stress protein [Gammaproteobacteria bacterium]
MAIYRRILLAVDLTDASREIGARACELAAELGAELEILHVIEPLPLMVADAPEIMAPAVLQTQDEIVRAARTRVAALASELGLPTSAASVQLGNTQIEIVRAARERKVDLIVLGSRERHGLSLLVDFTEDAVLHKAPCDVLAVRVHPTA